MSRMTQGKTHETRSVSSIEYHAVFVVIILTFGSVMVALLLLLKIIKLNIPIVLHFLKHMYSSDGVYSHPFDSNKMLYTPVRIKRDIGFYMKIPIYY